MVYNYVPVGSWKNFVFKKNPIFATPVFLLFKEKENTNFTKKYGFENISIYQYC